MKQKLRKYNKKEPFKKLTFLCFAALIFLVACSAATAESKTETIDDSIDDTDFRNDPLDGSGVSRGSIAFVALLDQVTLAEKHDSSYNKVEISLRSYPPAIDALEANEAALYKKFIPSDALGMASADESAFVGTFSSDYDGSKLPNAESYSAPYFKFQVAGKYVFQYRFYNEDDNTISEIITEVAFTLTINDMIDFRNACIDSTHAQSNAFVARLEEVSLAEEHDSSYNKVEISLLSYPPAIDAQSASEAALYKKFIPSDTSSGMARTDESAFVDTFSSDYDGSKLPGAEFILLLILSFGFREATCFSIDFIVKVVTQFPK